MDKEHLERVLRRGLTAEAKVVLLHLMVSPERANDMAHDLYLQEGDVQGALNELLQAGFIELTQRVKVLPGATADPEPEEGV